MKLFIIIIHIIISIPIFSLQIVVPPGCQSLAVADYDNDNDNDIIIGNKVLWENTNPRLTILENIDGYFSIIDTSFVFCGGNDILAVNINNDNLTDFVALGADFSSGEATRFLRSFLNDGNFGFDYTDVLFETDEVIRNVSGGYINSDSFEDIVVDSNVGDFWCVLYNVSGSYLEPEYHYENLNILDIVCNTLNNDNLFDVVISGWDTKFYFSTGTDFNEFYIDHIHTNSNLSIVDYDLDGDNDVIGYINNMGTTTLIYYYENIGENEFYLSDTLIVNPGFSNISFTDMNNDNYYDLVCFGAPGLYIYYNNGSNDFNEYDSYYIPDLSNYYFPLWCGDLDGNYTPDVAITAGNGPRLITFYNDGLGILLSDPVSSNSDNQSLECNLTISCYPNPVNSEVSFLFELFDSSFVNFSIYNIKGQLISVLLNETKNKGLCSIVWNGENNIGSLVSNGIYIYRVKINDKMFSGKFQLLK
ncbi:MAG: hypothetical protein APR54_04970 [Candidatus Cloacimonas sp. SDB]|nr:MAG: hypothetical protein APR54_04970 [Candidatus Cloacimonas sp. SDB]